MSKPGTEILEHYSDCALHNEPAFPRGECDCGGYAALVDAPEPIPATPDNSAVERRRNP